MSKVDDMRRQREERFAESARRAASAPKRAAVVAPPETKAAAAPLDDGVEPAPPTRSVASKGASAEEGRCPECGKTKPLQNGVMASHQHGFGKPCAGSRRAPEPTA